MESDGQSGDYAAVGNFERLIEEVESENVSEYPNPQNIEEEKALAVGMAEKAKEFVDKGSEIYQGNLPDGAKEYH